MWNVVYFATGSQINMPEIQHHPDVENMYSQNSIYIFTKHMKTEPLKILTSMFLDTNTQCKPNLIVADVVE